jgi:hypothetical protein
VAITDGDPQPHQAPPPPNRHRGALKQPPRKSHRRSRPTHQQRRTQRPPPTPTTETFERQPQPRAVVKGALIRPPGSARSTSLAHQAETAFRLFARVLAAARLIASAQADVHPDEIRVSGVVAPEPCLRGHAGPRPDGRADRTAASAQNGARTPVSQQCGRGSAIQRPWTAATDGHLFHFAVGMHSCTVAGPSCCLSAARALRPGAAPPDRIAAADGRRGFDEYREILDGSSVAGGVARQRG